ncbi:MAG: phosphoribosylformylglycinamidine cyclo-ligase [Chloroflexi bacterium]|nr:phosphoribosylformylglycinamidine cyclo-ligase [Chloroflexota bacterium]
MLTGQQADRPGSTTYAAAGVDVEGEERGMGGLLAWAQQSFTLRLGPGRPCLPLGYYANVLDLGNGTGLAISTDGVGTKLFIAELMHRYDTVGIDCIAMNVNDVLCVGAEPIAMVDYVAVEAPHADFLEQLGRGLYEGARRARITIPGGELAQVREMIRGVRPGYGFDLVGTAVGTVPLDRIIVGERVEPGDSVVGLRSSGLHSNGYTLARRVFFDRLGWTVDRYVPEFGRSLGEELLEPTRIYVPEVLDMLRAGLDIRGLIHVTGDGFLNLVRLKAEVGVVVEQLPEPLAVFAVLQEAGGVTDEEMYSVYNMGIGFCVVVPERDVERVISIARSHGVEGYRIGYTVADARRTVRLEPLGLIGRGSAFQRAGTNR